MNRDLRREIFLLCLVVVLVFGAVFTHQFTSWDDPFTIAQNPGLTPPTLASLKEIFTTPAMALWVPATSTAWWLLAHLGWNGHEMATWPFFAANLLLHALSGIAVLLLLKTLLPDSPHRNPLALAGALLFTLHPAQAGTVAWPSGLKDLLFADLALWSLLLLIKDRRLAATLLFALALLAKPTAVVVPLMALVLLRLHPPLKPARGLWPLFILWSLLAALCAVWTRLVQSSQPAWAIAPLADRPWIALDAIGWYACHVLIPWPLTIDPARSPREVMAHGVPWATVLPGLVFLAALPVLRKRAPLAFTGALLFLIPLLPLLGLVPFDFQAYSTVTDHYLYLPLFGVALLATAILSQHLNTKPSATKATTAAIIAALLASALLSELHLRDWKDDHTLLTATLNASPRSWGAPTNLAVALLAKPNVSADDLQQAYKLASRGLELNPHTPAGWAVLASIAIRQGDLAQAETAYKQGLASTPRDAQLNAGYANVLIALNRLDEAEQHAKTAIDAAPEFYRGYAHLAVIHAKTGRTDSAIQLLRKTLELAPDDVESLINLALLLQDRSPAEATRLFTRAATLAPNHPKVQQERARFGL